MGDARIRPGQRYAWRGSSLLIAGVDGGCGEGESLSGYYFREARHLRTLRLELDGRRPWLCETAAPAPDRLELVYIHPEMTRFGGGGSGQSGDEIERDEHGIPYRALDLRLALRVGVAGLEAEVQVANRSREEVGVTLGWDLDADFADLQEAHGGERQQEAPVSREPDGASLRFRYGHPELPLETRVSASGGGDWRAAGENRLEMRLRLAPQQRVSAVLRVEPVDPERPLSAADAERREERLRRWAAGLTRVEVPGDRRLEEVVRRNVRDLASFPLLEGDDDEWLALQAGMPLYPALFGRDALTAGWQAASLDRGESLEASLTCLGRMQSGRVDDWRDEEPGRIPYQVRRGPLARLNVNPFAAYYADYASPLMFVVALAHCYAWSGDRRSLERHWGTAERILEWARERGDRDGDGYLEYQTRSSKGVKNQGWKDSGNAIVDEDGRTVPVPLATCEIQGYWFAAQQLMAAMAGFLGRVGDAKAWLRSALDLKKRFNRDWWMEEESFFAMAMDPDKRLVRSVGSNPAHCLAAGIVSGEHVPPLVGRLFAPDLFSGWGVRTLSSRHPAYSPLSYHLGSVWAVENATLALGLRRFGLDVRAAEIARALFDLARLYPEDRIPECVGGYDRWERWDGWDGWAGWDGWDGWAGSDGREGTTPGAYPRANTPQTWNASAFPLLLHALLGLQPVAPLDLLVVDPALPSWLPEVVLHDLRVGGATATLRFWRDAEGRSHAELLRLKGTLHLVRQPPPESLTARPSDRFRALVDGILHL